MYLSEGQYALDGVVFGDASGAGPYAVLESGDETGGAEVRAQDIEMPRGDSLRFGRDYFTPPERHFIVGVDTADPLALPRLRALWRADEVRARPGAASTLRWRLGGRSFQAMGRPRGFAVLGAASFDPTWSVVELSWQYRDTYVLDEAPHSVVLGAFSQASGTGLILPAVLPWNLGSAPAERRGVIEAAGLLPAPFTVTITGPVSGTATDLRVTGDGWRLDFGSLTLSPRDALVVDTFARSATLGGRSVATALSFDSSLSARIRPGLNSFAFTCSDPTASTRAVIEWSDPIPIF